MHVHLSSTNSPDYFTRREQPCPRELKNAHYGDTYRMAHINMCLDMRSVVRAAGPVVDGTRADVFYEVASRAALDDLLRDDPYVISGVWASLRLRTLEHFVEPLSMIEVCLDASRGVVTVEGRVTDERHALSALRRMRDAEVVAVGGLFEDGTVVAWVRTSGPSEALACLARGGLELQSAVCQSLVWVL